MNASVLANTSVTAELNHPVIRVAQGHQAEVFTEVYQNDTNMAIWHRDITEAVKRDVDTVFDEHPRLQLSMTVTPANTINGLGHAVPSALGHDIAQLVDMFCCLFELQRVGLRLSVLDRAMCPKFHVDRVPCRLITTFSGSATQWLPHDTVDRSKLGLGSDGKTDEESGLYQKAEDIQQLQSGDVALLKGELWQGNEGAGLVHRSPALEANEKRLLMTLDFSD